MNNKYVEVINYLWGIFDYAHRHGLKVKAYKLSVEQWKTYTDTCHNWYNPTFNGVPLRVKPDAPDNHYGKSMLEMCFEGRMALSTEALRD